MVLKLETSMSFSGVLLRQKSQFLFLSFLFRDKVLNFGVHPFPHFMYISDLSNHVTF